MRRTPTSFVLCLLFMLLPWPTVGELVPGLDLDQLVHDSDLIVTGEVISLDARSEVAAHRNSSELTGGKLHVNYVLKGNMQSTEMHFVFSFPDVSVGLHSQGVFFLKLKGENSGEAEFTSSYYPFAPAIVTVAPQGETPTDRVVFAIARAMTSSEGDRFGRKIMAAYFLSTSKSASSLMELRAVLNDPDQEISIRAAGSLLQRNDISALPLAVDAVLHGRPGASKESVDNLTRAIASGVSDKNSVSLLVQLLQSADPDVRRAGAAALRRTGSERAIRPLSSLLDDPDLDTRYYAVVGLAEITGKTEWRPNMEDFHADQKKYLNFWHDWRAGQP